jgi:hypothetical protein
METFAQDIRYASRAFVRPAASAAVISLAIGVGANTAVFSEGGCS